jgi:hypothetical protein
MRHLTSAELVDAIEGRLPNGRLAHLAGCEACKRRIDELEAGLHHAVALEIPEPSPLFWEHLSGRILEAVAREQAVPAPSWWSRWSPRQWAVAAAMAAAMVAALLGGLLRPGSPLQPIDGPARVRSTLETAPEAVDTDDWALVAAMADGLSLDEAADAGWPIGPATADRALVELTLDERRELARLLERELHQPKS